MTHDVIVIGGSYAGMAAALQLLRARRSVLILDAGQRRNRFVSHAHGFLGQDGADPAVIAAEARAQLERYPTLTWIDTTATAASGCKEDFTVSTADGTTHHGRRILLATGLTDALPPVPGLAERWGQSVFHCPYCHGYELGGGPIGVIGSGPMSAHQAEIVNEWGPVTLFTNDALDPDPAPLLARGITIERTPIARLEGTTDVILTDGRSLGFSGLFTATRTSPTGTLWSDLGCAIDETMMGEQIRTDEMKETTIPGVHACGDVARMPHTLSLAVGDGAWAGACVHRSLVF